MRFNQSYNNKLSIRISDSQYDYLDKLSNSLGISISDLLRMMIDSFIVKSLKEGGSNAE